MTPYETVDFGAICFTYQPQIEGYLSRPGEQRYLPSAGDGRAVMPSVTAIGGHTMITCNQIAGTAAALSMAGLYRKSGCQPRNISANVRIAGW